MTNVRKGRSAEVRAYLAGLSPKTRAAVIKLGDTIRASVPDAEDGFSYRIPAVKLDGKIVFWYAGWANHTSMYPVSEAFARAHDIDVSKFETKKGTIRFPLTKPIPVTLVKRLVKARLADMLSRG